MLQNLRTSQYSQLPLASDGKLAKIYERLEPGQTPLMRGPETLFFHDDGTMYATTENGNLVSFSDIQTESDGRQTVRVQKVKDLGRGRPMAGKFLGDTLYIADAFQGLTHIQNVSDPHSNVEIVASSVLDDRVETPINLADDVAVAPQSGMVYFTDGECST